MSNRRFSRCCKNFHFSKQLAGFTQSKQWRIELLYRYERAKTSTITVLNVRKLYHYFVYFKLYVTLSGAGPVSLENNKLATPGKLSIQTLTLTNLFDKVPSGFLNNFGNCIDNSFWLLHRWSKTKNVSNAPQKFF